MNEQKFGYEVTIERHCDEDYHSEEQFGEWRTSHSNSFISIKPNAKYPDVVSTHDFKSGDEAYLVWFEYSTGDSFGNGHCSSVETTGLFHDKRIAQELVTAIEKFDGTERMDILNFEYASTNSFYFQTSDGQVFKYGFAPWTGYFETLELVHLEEVVIR